MWDILKIKPTTDEKEITNAYRNQLMNTNPEADPEGFKALRKAYEDALQYAKTRQKATSPIDQWVHQLEDLYNNYHECINIENWEELFDDPLCEGFDTRGMIEDRLLQFIDGHYYLTHEIWIFLNEQFHFMDRLEELYDKYPEDLINYIIRDGILYDDLLPAHYFYPGRSREAVEKYISMYREVTGMEMNQREGLLDQLAKLEESHPYGQILMLEYKAVNGENVLAEYEAILKQYPYNYKITYSYINSALDLKEVELAENLCDQYLENDPNNISIHYVLAQIYASKKEYKKGIDKINDIMGMVRGDDATLRTLNSTRSVYNESYIKQLEEIEGKSQENYLDLCWAYLQNELDEKAYELSQYLDPEQLDAFDYNNLMSYIHLTRKEYDESIETTNNVIEIISNMVDDGTEKTKKRLRRMPDMKNRRIEIYIQQEKYDLAKYHLEQLLEENPNDVEAYRSLCITALYTKNYEQLEQYANRYIELSRDNYSGYLFLSLALFHLGDDRGAFEANENAMRIYPYDLRSYTLKARILIRNGSYDPAKEILKVFEDNQFTEDLNYYFVKGLLAEYELQNYEEAAKYYQLASEQTDRLQDEDYNGDVFYRLLCVKGRTLNANKEEDCNYMLDLCEKTLSYDPNHIYALDYKAWLLVKAKKYLEALPIYQQLERLPKHPIEVEEQLALIYYDQLDQNANVCLEYCLKALEVEEDPDMIFKAGMCEMYIGKYEDAIEHFATLEKFDWKVDSYYRRSQAYANKEDLENALHFALLALEQVKERDNANKFFNNVVNLYLRMERYDDAIAFIKENEQYPSYKRPDEDLYTAYMQSGNYDELVKVIKEWTKKGFKNIGSQKNLHTLYRASKNKRKADQLINKQAFVARDEEHYDILYRDMIYQLDFKGAIKALLELIKLRKEAGYQDHVIQLSHLSFCYAMIGDIEKQHKYALLAKEYTEERLSHPFIQYKPLHLSRLAKINALLGNFDQVEELLKQSRTSPKCDTCTYCDCRDADQYEIDALILLGKYQEALEKAKQGAEKWKDDFDFDSQIRLLEKKLKKK